jgi:hypothetical protein
VAEDFSREELYQWISRLLVRVPNLPHLGVTYSDVITMEAGLALHLLRVLDELMPSSK